MPPFNCMDSCLLKNGVKFCDVIGMDRPDDQPTFTVVTTAKVGLGPEDSFELVSHATKFPVTILDCHVGVEGWNTACRLTPAPSEKHRNP
jgi:hypothetical protein